MDQWYVWRNQKPMLKRTVCQQLSMVVLWGCFASSGTGNLQHVEGKMDSLKYQEIQEKCHAVSLSMPSNRTMITSIPQILPRLGRFYSGHHSQLTNIWWDLNKASKPKNISEQQAIAHEEGLRLLGSAARSGCLVIHLICSRS